MSEFQKRIVDRYVALWNEPDGNLRDAAVAALWTHSGSHFIQTIVARDVLSIQARVARAHAEFVGSGNFVFRSAGNIAGHHDALKFNWHMVSTGTGAVAAVGFDFLLLDDDRIRVDYQFNEPPNPTAEANAIADRYVALWNEPDAERRAAAVAALWADDGQYLSETDDAKGHPAIEIAVTEAHERFAKQGFVFVSAKDAERNQEGLRLHWLMTPEAGGAPVATGFDFLILDDAGRIAADYQFTEPAPVS